MTVGIRELKAHLSEYVGRAAGGEEIVVTDRNRPVARIVAYHDTSNVERGIEEGWIEPPRRRSLGQVDRVRSSGSTLDLLGDDRG